MYGTLDSGIICLLGMVSVMMVVKISYHSAQELTSFGMHIAS